MRIFPNLTGKIPGPQKNAAEPSLDKSNSFPTQNALPHDMNPSRSKAAFMAMRSAGNRTAQKILDKLPAALKSTKTQGSAASGPAALLRQSHEVSYSKFCRHEQDINQAMTQWADGKNTLAHLLKPYTAPASKRNGGPSMDGLRSGVTTLLNGIEKAGSNAPVELRNAARELGATPIFRVIGEDGKPMDYTLLNFATPGDHGIGAIDNLDIPPAHRQQIAERLALALGELRQIGDAYVNNSASTPARLLKDTEYVVVPSKGDGPGKPDPGRPSGAPGSRQSEVVPVPQPSSHSSMARPTARPAGPRAQGSHTQGPHTQAPAISEATPHSDVGVPPRRVPAGPRPMPGKAAS